MLYIFLISDFICNVLNIAFREYSEWIDWFNKKKKNNIKTYWYNMLQYQVHHTGHVIQYKTQTYRVSRECSLFTQYDLNLYSELIRMKFKTYLQNFIFTKNLFIYYFLFIAFKVKSCRMEKQGQPSKMYFHYFPLCSKLHIFVPLLYQ